MYGWTVASMYNLQEGVGVRRASLQLNRKRCEEDDLNRRTYRLKNFPKSE